MNLPANIKSIAFLLCFVASLGLAERLPNRDKGPVDLDSRWELFVDEWLIASRSGISLELQEPDRREVVLMTDAPWEGNTSAYFSVVQDGALIRLYYRGSVLSVDDFSEEQVTCVAESTDGIHFTRPNVGLIEVNGSKENNVVWKGIESHNFMAFLDLNPNCKPHERYKALGGMKEIGANWQEKVVAGGLYAFVSADGIRWRKLQKDPIITEGAFDSMNVAFWDESRGSYACYSRIFPNQIRAVQSSRSPDFVNWGKGVANRYATGVPLEHFYTNATIPCPGAEHLLLSFPMRFMPDRKKIEGHPFPGISDAVFVSSRDGITWDRTFSDAWVRPGLDERNWTDRSNMTAAGIAQTGPGEWSLYISEHYLWPDNRLRRLVLPRHRIASAHAGAEGGEFTTRPLSLSGAPLTLNYATSAAGSIRVELQHESGAPLEGFSVDDMAPLFGDELEGVVQWKSGSDLTALAGRTVRVRFVLQDADVFALRFGPTQNSNSPLP